MAISIQVMTCWKESERCSTKNDGETKKKKTGVGGGGDNGWGSPLRYAPPVVEDQNPSNSPKFFSIKKKKKKIPVSGIKLVIKLLRN